MVFMSKNKHFLGFSVRTVLIILTAILVGYVVYQNWPDILETLRHLRDANGFVLMLLIPEQLFMYYACGQIFFSYLKHRKNVKKFSNKSCEGLLYYREKQIVARDVIILRKK